MSSWPLEKRTPCRKRNLCVKPSGEVVGSDSAGTGRKPPFGAGSINVLKRKKASMASLSEKTCAASIDRGSAPTASRRVPPRFGVSAADKEAAVNRRRRRIFTEANEGNEDGENGVRRGLRQSQRDSSERGVGVFTFVLFVCFCAKSPAGAQLLFPFHPSSFDPAVFKARGRPEAARRQTFQPGLPRYLRVQLHEKNPGRIVND